MSKAKQLSDFINEIPYDNTASGLTAVDVQGAIDETRKRFDKHFLLMGA